MTDAYRIGTDLGYVQSWGRILFPLKRSVEIPFFFGTTWGLFLADNAGSLAIFNAVVF